MVVRIFDSNFNLKAELTNITSVAQTKYINSAGAFEIKLSSIPNANVGDFIYTIGNDFQRYDGIITQVSGEINAGVAEYTLSGYELLHILSFRAPVYNGHVLSYGGEYAEDILRDIVTKLFLSPDIDDRRIDCVTYAHVSAQNKRISISVDTSSIGTALTMLDDINSESGYGLFAELDPLYGKIRFNPCIPRDSAVILSPVYDNLIGESFRASESTWKNVAYYAVTENDITTIYSEGLNAGTGWTRRETGIAADAGDSTLAQKASIIHMQLGNYKRTENYSGEYVKSGSFVFGDDFFLGDRVLYKGAYGQTRAQVIGYTQTLDSSGNRLQLLFGDNTESRLNNIKRISGVG